MNSFKYLIQKSPRRLMDRLGKFEYEIGFNGRHSQCPTLGRGQAAENYLLYLRVSEPLDSLSYMDLFFAYNDDSARCLDQTLPELGNLGRCRNVRPRSVERLDRVHVELSCLDVDRFAMQCARIAPDLYGFA